MSRLSLLTAGLLILFAIFQGYVKHQARTQRLVYDENESFASFTRPTVQGRSVHLDSVVHNHTVVWVTFWASWCGPCKVEMSMLADLYEKHHDQGFAVVAVNVREDSTTVRSFLESTLSRIQSCWTRRARSPISFVSRPFRRPFC